MNPVIGSVLDGYRILAEAGTGSCGKVFRAENVLTGETVALKVLTGTRDLVERELGAIRLYQKIEHPNLIRIRHAKQEGDTLFYVMDWCESTIARQNVSPEELLKDAENLAEALSILHHGGLVHRDVKPDNIFIFNGKPVLGDIGLVTRQAGASFAGSPGFLAPELLRGAAPGPYSDCYALAMSLYCILSGKPPESFPLYNGTLSPAAAVLMQTILAVCSDRANIRTADDFLKALQLPPGKKRSPVLLYCLIAAAVIAVILFFIILSDLDWDEPNRGARIPKPRFIEMPGKKTKKDKPPASAGKVQTQPKNIKTPSAETTH